MMMMVYQKEHSNLITNLRATNEPVLSVTGDRVPVITEPRDTDVAVSAGQPVTLTSSIRQRRKIERNTSAPLPGMLQVISHFVHLYMALVTTHEVACYIVLVVSVCLSV